jgi:hypothetical protein
VKTGIRKLYGTVYTAGTANYGFTEYTLDFTSTDVVAWNQHGTSSSHDYKQVLFPQSSKTEMYRYRYCWRKYNNCRDIKLDRSLSRIFPLHNNGNSRGVTSAPNSNRLPSWPRANFTFNIVGHTLTEPE